MKYLIITNPDYTNTVKVGVSLVPENEPLKFFLSNVRLLDIPELLLSVSQSKGYSQEFISLKFYHEMDWEDKEDIDIREGDVNVYVYQFGETVLKEFLFKQILLDYCTKLLHVYQDDQSLPPSWKEDMRQGLGKLSLEPSSRQ